MYSLYRAELPTLSPVNLTYSLFISGKIRRVFSGRKTLQIMAPGLRKAPGQKTPGLAQKTLSRAGKVAARLGGTASDAAVSGVVSGVIAKAFAKRDQYGVEIVSYPLVSESVGAPAGNSSVVQRPAGSDGGRPGAKTEQKLKPRVLKISLKKLAASGAAAPRARVAAAVVLAAPLTLFMSLTGAVL